MRHPQIFTKCAPLFLLLLLCISAPHSRAQNQTPANVAPPVGWTDPETGLTWTKSDNGSDVDWKQATTYCTNLRQGGYSDWRLPTIDELQGIYDPSVDVPGRGPDGNVVPWHAKGNLKFSGWPWSSSLDKNTKFAWYFAFINGRRLIERTDSSTNDRALCVRR
jgi:hypothetical protein